MGPEDLKMLRETYRLTLENNRMLRKMRRQALVHTIVWLIIYAALILAPIWFYMTYLDGAVQQLLKAYDAFEGSNSHTAQQYGQFQDAVDNLREKLPGFSGTTTAQ